MNVVTLVGRLGADPDFNETSGGAEMARFSLATNRRERRGEGDWVTVADWHRIVCFGATAKNTVDFLRKGSEAAVEGRIQTRSWEDNEGNKRTVTEVVAHRVHFIGGRKDG